MLIEREDAAALLKRCCAGQKEGRCERACDHAASAAGPETVRDAGGCSGAGVYAPSVGRDLTDIAGCRPQGGNAVRILANGTDSFGAMLDLVRTAETEVRFENFIFRADAVGRAFAGELRDRAEEGVLVRVLHDPAGALMARTLPAEFLFRGSSADVRLFNLAWPTSRVRRLGRDHRKLVVADGARMVAGGICLADPWVGNCVRHCTWRDSAVYVEGPAAGVAAETFDEMWRLGRRAIPGPEHSAERPVVPADPAAGEVAVRLVTDLGPLRRTGAMLERVFDAARHEVLITNPYFIPPATLRRALIGAASRGVEVVVLIPGHNNHPIAGLSAEEQLGELLRHGVEVFRWQGAMIHAKSVVVDGEWTLVGSSNLDTLSLARNAELNVEIHGSAVGGIMARLFRQDCRESVPFTLGDWRHRPRGRRAAARLAATLSAWQ